MSNIPKATLSRYPLYLKALRKLKYKGVDKVMSSQLADYVAIKPTTIRRDFSLIGSLGKQGYGYDVNYLIDIFSRELGVNYDEKLILVGAGNLGKAMLNYNNWNFVTGEIVCAFDIRPDLVGDISVPVYDIRELEKYMPEDCRIAILCVSGDVQNTIDHLAAAGIKGIVDFTHVHYIVPPGVTIRSVDIVSTIQELVYEMNSF